MRGTVVVTTCDGFNDRVAVRASGITVGNVNDVVLEETTGWQSVDMELIRITTWVQSLRVTDRELDLCLVWRTTGGRIRRIADSKPYAEVAGDNDRGGGVLGGRWERRAGKGAGEGTAAV